MNARLLTPDDTDRGCFFDMPVMAFQDSDIDCFETWVWLSDLFAD